MDRLSVIYSTISRRHPTQLNHSTSSDAWRLAAINNARPTQSMDGNKGRRRADIRTSGGESGTPGAAQGTAGRYRSRAGPITAGRIADP